MHTRRLQYSELVKLRSESRLVPLFQPTSASSEPLTCPSCLEYKGENIVIHLKCWRALCTPCTIDLISQQQSCPFCRDPLSGDLLEPTWVCKPPPILQQFIDNVEYECNACKRLLKYFDAKTHSNHCTANEVHQPPPYVPPRGEGQLIYRELVSNPPTVLQDRSSGPRRLVIQHHNGRQIVSRMISAFKTVAHWRQQIADLAGSSVASIKIFKFIHRELEDSHTIQEVCQSRGATWLCSFDTHHPDFQQFCTLAETSAFLTLFEPGQRPVIPRHIEPLEDGWQEGWGNL